jgi:anti-anti-sigma regulatory factor
MGIAARRHKKNSHQETSMFSCTGAGDPGHMVAKLSGDLTLEHSKEIHAELLAHLSRDGAMTIDLSESTKIDLSFVQILSALLKDPDTKIRFAPLPKHVINTATRLGADKLIKEISNRGEENA